MATFLLVTAVLVALDLVSWFRTAPLRRGANLVARDPPSGPFSFSSSRATFLPSVAGLAAASWGLARIRPAKGLAFVLALVLVAAGTFIAIAGLVARVTRVHADGDGLVVTLARRPPFRASWGQLQGLVPPTTPPGGWRLVGGGGKGQTLMPSDVWGHEDVLELILVRTALRFDGRGWFRSGQEATTRVNPRAR
jgi:hypothetical protein